MYQSNNFMCGRGNVNSEAISTAPAYHSYKTDDDIADVVAAEYFPANFDFNEDEVLVDDVIFIKAADANGFYIVLDAAAPEIEEVGA